MSLFTLSPDTLVSMDKRKSSLTQGLLFQSQANEQTSCGFTCSNFVVLPGKLMVCFMWEAKSQEMY